ncbi:MAG: response regulator transcription factor [Oscillospiraceae bacterium]|nr:response regulator transcription factor [Oscillospiraceae bacterium]
MYKIFIAEDDKALVQQLKKAISAWNYDVCCVRDFQNITSEFQAFQPHLVLLDIMLPFYNGYHWCGELRKISKVPIVFLSSASDNMNIVMAMQMGGDDFIAKPVDTTVLIAKIQAILRRTYDMTGTAPTVEHKGAALNLNDNTLEYCGKSIELTKNEFRIMLTLMEHKGKIVSRDTLMIKLWQDDCYVEENTLTVNVTRLRKKLSEIGLNDFIKTKIGSGYIIEL